MKFLLKVPIRNSEVIEKDTERDFYLNAKQAVDYGLVDKILDPPDK